jgi:hydroxyacylglutathione hydrolase
MISARPVPILRDNYAWLLREAANGACAVVDPAEAEPVAKAIDAAGGRLDLILLTHHHADHVGGTEALRTRYGARVAGAAADRERLPALDLPLADGDAVALGGAEGHVIATPGQTLGHLCYFFPAEGLLFSGDTLFSLGCGRLFEGTAEQMFASLCRLAALPPATRVCCGHEYTEANARFALAEEPDNAALRSYAEQIAALRARGEPSVPSLLATELAANPFLRAADAADFAARRARKDRF